MQIPANYKRILIVDDEIQVRQMVQACLENFAGWEVWVAVSGREGVRLAELFQPNVILLDVQMPEMDGVTTLATIRDNPAIQSIPVIFLTAETNLTQPKTYTALGAQGAIAKPFDPLVLAQQIATLLDWSLPEP